MNKREVIDYLGGATKACKVLEYAHPNCIHNWPDPLPNATMRSIVMRMKAAGVKIPGSWVKAK